MRCVLAVDDDPAILDVTTKFLLHRGYEVLRAECADEAMAIARSRHVDVVIADIVMRGMDGFALSRAIKADDRTRNVKVIILSGYMCEDDAKVIESVSSCDAVMSKPVELVDLDNTIRRLTGNGDEGAHE